MDDYVKLARESLENYVLNNKVIEVPDWVKGELLTKKAGVFVTLYKNKTLRGCVGTFLPTTKNLAQEIIRNAISASEDPRFWPVSKDELPLLTYEVSILSEPVLVKDKAKLDPKKYGVIVSTGNGRRGLLLPNIERVNTVGEQISIACLKAGINPNIEKITLYCFNVEKHS